MFIIIIIIIIQFEILIGNQKAFWGSYWSLVVTIKNEIKLATRPEP